MLNSTSSRILRMQQYVLTVMSLKKSLGAQDLCLSLVIPTQKISTQLTPSQKKSPTPPLRISKHCFEIMINEIIFRELILVTHIYAKAKFDLVRDFFQTLAWKIMSFRNFSSTQENARSSQLLRTNASFCLWIETLAASDFLSLNLEVCLCEWGSKGNQNPLQSRPVCILKNLASLRA